MAISAKTLYEDVAREVGTGVGTEALAAAFVRCCNRSLDELSLVADLAARFDHIASTDADIDDDLDDEYEYIVKAGIMLHLYRSGYRPRDPKLAAVVMGDAVRAWEDAKDAFIMAEDNAAQTALDADTPMIGMTKEDA